MPDETKTEISGDMKGKQAPSRARIFVPILLLIALLVGGYFLYESYQVESTDDAQIDGHIIAISPRIGGQVIDVKVKEGQEVKAGDVLVVLDPRDYQVALEQAQAQFLDAKANALGSQINVPVTRTSTRSTVSSAQANVINAEAGITGAQKNLEAAKAQVALAEANVVKSDADLIRYKQLVDHENVSQQQYDQAVATAKANRAQLESAKATAQAAQESLEQAKQRLVQAQADLRTAQTAPQQVSIIETRAKSAEAQVKQRQAQIDQAQLNLEYTTIKAPHAGIISKKTVEVGQNVSVGQELMALVSVDDVWVTANFKETQLAHMRVGQPVNVKVDAYSNKTYKARVTAIQGASGEKLSILPPENATGNYVKVVQRIPVRIDFDPSENQDRLLRPGMSVSPEVQVR